MLIHSIHSLCYLVYCQRILEDVITVVPIAICVAVPGFLRGLKLFTGVILLYQVSVLDRQIILLSPPICRDSMDSNFSFTYFRSSIRS